jgi:primosomal replication protein N
MMRVLHFASKFDGRGMRRQEPFGTALCDFQLKYRQTDIENRGHILAGARQNKQFEILFICK